MMKRNSATMGIDRSKLALSLFLLRVLAAAVVRLPSTR